MRTLAAVPGALLVVLAILGGAGATAAAPDEVASRDVLADPTALDAFVALRGAR